MNVHCKDGKQNPSKQARFSCHFCPWNSLPLFKNNRSTCLLTTWCEKSCASQADDMLSPWSRESDLLPTVSHGSGGAAPPVAACQSTRRIHPKWQVPEQQLCGACLLVSWCFFFSFYAGLYPMKSPSFTLIAVGNMWSLIKNIFSVEIAFISWANFSWPSTHQSFFGKGNSSLWVSKCQATEQKERGGERKKQLTSLLQSICTKSLGRISF